MEEIAEFRILESRASLLFADNEGKKLEGFVRVIRIKTDDPRFLEIGRLEKKLKAEIDKSFFYGWSIERKPNREELERADLFLLREREGVEPAGEECGTLYDESSSCPVCGSGAKQIGPLFLKSKRIPKKYDFAATIAGEIVMSRRAVETFRRHGIKGASFEPVRTKPDVESEEWYQLIVESAQAEIITPTRVGIDPFDDDPTGRFRCPLGHLIGLNLLSGVTISSETRGEADIFASRQFIGVRRGLLRPERLIFISQKVRKLIESEKLKPAASEIVHVV